MLEFADFDVSKCDDVDSKLQEYENALSHNKSGYRPYYKRDVAETMVNTYNPEWLSAWNGNMDIQLCLDFFAVITYISDYYSKDDSGTMQLLLNELKKFSSFALIFDSLSLVTVICYHTSYIMYHII